MRRPRSHLARLAALLALGLALACRPVDPLPGPGEAVDCVCAYNRDLACVVVKTEPDTPRAEYQGRTYWFCSEGCRQAFLKDPRKYAAKPGR